MSYYSVSYCLILCLIVLHHICYITWHYVTVSHYLFYFCYIWKNENIFETSIIYTSWWLYMIQDTCICTSEYKQRAARCKYLKIGVWDRFGEEKINSTDQLGPEREGFADCAHVYMWVSNVPRFCWPYID